MSNAASPTGVRRGSSFGQFVTAATTADDSDKGESASKDAERRDQAKVALAAAVKECRQTVLDSVRTNRYPIEKALDGLASFAEGAITRLGEAEADSCRRKLKTQANMLALKLETARVAASTRLEHKSVEISATFERKFDDKLKAIANGQLEQQLLSRIEEQKEELEELRPLRDELKSSGRRLAETEIEKRTLHHVLTELQGEVQACIDGIARAGKRDLAAPLLTVENGGALRDVVLEAIAGYSEMRLRAIDRIQGMTSEVDGLESALIARAAGAVIDANQAVAAAAAEGAGARQAVASAKERIAELEREVGECRESSGRDAEEIAALKLQASEKGAQLAAAMGKLAKLKAEADRQSAAEDERLQRMAEELEAKAGDKEAAVRRAHDGALRAAQEAEAELKREIHTLEDAVMTKREQVETLEERLGKSFERLQAAMVEQQAQESELLAAREEQRAMAEELAAAAQAMAESTGAASAKAANELAETRTKAAQMEVQIGELTAEVAELQSEVSELRQLAGQQDADGSNAKDMAARLALAEDRAAQAEADLAHARDAAPGSELEAEVARARDDLAHKDGELASVRGELEALRASGGGRIEGAEQAMEEVDEARVKLQQMQELLQRSKADRAALVDYALKSLTQLSGHMAYTLGGLRIGQDRSSRAPLLRVQSYEPRTMPSKGNSSRQHSTRLWTTAEGGKVRHPQMRLPRLAPQSRLAALATHPTLYRMRHTPHT